MAANVRDFHEAVKATTEQTRALKNSNNKGNRGHHDTGRRRLGLDHVQGTKDIAEGTDPSVTSTQLKLPCGTESADPQKKTKAPKLDNEPITLAEGDLYDIGNIVREVTREVLLEAMTK